MKENNISDIINEFKNEVCYFNQMQLFSMLPSEKNYFLDQIEERTQDVIMQILLMENSNTDMENSNSTIQNKNTDSQLPNTNTIEQKEFTLEELSTFNGTNGKPAYVAVKGIVYDVTSKAKWAGGTHNGLFAGKDLSMQFLGCHLGMPGVLESLPKVGIIKKI